MRSLRVFLCAVVLLGLYGCGGGSSRSVGSSPPPPEPPVLNGNWEIQAVSQLAVNTTYLMGGSLNTTGTSVSGTLHFLNYSCFFKNGNTIYDIPVTGTVSSTGALLLTRSCSH